MAEDTLGQSILPILRLITDAIFINADPNDLIFPRAATRIGPKYQALVAPALGEPIPPVPGLPASVTTAANSGVCPRAQRLIVCLCSMMQKV